MGEAGRKKRHTKRDEQNPSETLVTVDTPRERSTDHAMRIGRGNPSPRLVLASEAGTRKTAKKDCRCGGIRVYRQRISYRLWRTAGPDPPGTMQKLLAKLLPHSRISAPAFPANRPT